MLRRIVEMAADVTNKAKKKSNEGKTVFPAIG